MDKQFHPVLPCHLLASNSVLGTLFSRELKQLKQIKSLRFNLFSKTYNTICFHLHYFIHTH